MPNDFLNGGIPQEIYDAFNTLIFSRERKITAKLFWKVYFILKTLNVPGDIVECGCFKGSGILGWLKTLKTFGPNSYKKVIGFDFFDGENVLKSLNGIEKKNMAELFQSRKFNPKSDYILYLKEQIEKAGFSENDYKLIKGDIIETSKTYVNDYPGSKFSILYLDLDLAEPTYQTLNNMWNKVSTGGYIIFDEYGVGEWTETIGVDKFCKENNLKINVIQAECPTAFIIKV